jgi:hypothetical protein
MTDMQKIQQHVKLMQAMDEVPATGSGEVGPTPAKASQVFFAGQDKEKDGEGSAGRTDYHDPGHTEKWGQKRDKAKGYCRKCDKTHITGDHRCTARCQCCGKGGHCKANCYKRKQI